MKRYIIALCVLAVVAVALVVGCSPFFPAAASGRNNESGLKVTVSCGALAGGTSRGLINDGLVQSVTVEAKNSSGSVVGSGDLTKKASYWSGSIHVSENGMITFHARAMDQDKITLYYEGWATANVTQSGGSVTIPMSTVTGLVGEWLFSGNADDTSGNNLSGTVSGATLATDRFGNANKAYSFNGSSSITVADDSALHFGTGDFTVSGWAIYNSTAENTLVSKAVVSGGWTGICLNGNFPSAGRFRLTAKENSGYVDSTNSDTNNGSWHHFVCVRSGTALEMYIDGILDASGTDTPTDVTNSASLLFGAHQSGTCPFSGSLDDVRIYNRALSADEVDGLYHEGG